MIDATRSFGRRGFLGTFATALAALGTGTLTARPRSMRSPSFESPMFEDTPGFDEWLGKIAGKHRQVFDAPAPNGGLPLAWARVFLSTNNDLGIQDSDLSAVVILRHSAIPLAMADVVWQKYKFGESFNITDEATKAPSVRNPYWNPKPGELPFPDMSLDQLQKRGVMFGVCNMAITFLSGMTAKKMNADAAMVKKDWIAALLPGIQLVPSGVLAVNRAQEHGCTYCFAG